MKIQRNLGSSCLCNVLDSPFPPARPEAHSSIRVRVLQNGAVVPHSRQWRVQYLIQIKRLPLRRDLNRQGMRARRDRGLVAQLPVVFRELECGVGVLDFYFIYEAVPSRVGDVVRVFGDCYCPEDAD